MSPQIDPNPSYEPPRQKRQRPDSGVYHFALYYLTGVRSSPLLFKLDGGSPCLFEFYDEAVEACREIHQNRKKLGLVGVEVRRIAPNEAQAVMTPMHQDAAMWDARLEAFERQQKGLREYPNRTHVKGQPVLQDRTPKRREKAVPHDRIDALIGLLLLGMLGQDLFAEKAAA